MSLTGLNGSKINWGDVKEDTPIDSLAKPAAAAATTAAPVASSAPVAAAASAPSSSSNSSGVESVTSEMSKAAIGVPSPSPSPDEADESDVQLSAHSGLHPNDKTAEVSVTVAQDDGAASSSSTPANPTIYRAVETFDQLGLTKELLSGVYAMKFTTPSKIQAQALPIIMSQQSVVRDSQGKYINSKQKQANTHPIDESCVPHDSSFFLLTFLISFQTSKFDWSSAPWFRSV